MDNSKLKHVKKSLRLLPIALSSLLAACGGSPGEADVRAALAKQIDDSRAQAEQIFGKNDFLNRQMAEQKQAVAAVKLIGCKADGEKAYVCDVEGKAGAARVRMLKGSEGWIASDPGKG